MHNRAFRELIAIGAAGVVVSSAVSAQDKTIVLRAARMFDGHDIRAPGIVVVSGSVIT